MPCVQIHRMFYDLIIRLRQAHLPQQARLQCYSKRKQSSDRFGPVVCSVTTSSWLLKKSSLPVASWFTIESPQTVHSGTVLLQGTCAPKANTQFFFLPTTKETI